MNFGEEDVLIVSQLCEVLKLMLKYMKLSRRIVKMLDKPQNPLLVHVFLLPLTY